MFSSFVDFVEFDCECSIIIAIVLANCFLYCYYVFNENFISSL